jgi:ABC-2 type transport system ATP-binding protein
MTDEAVVRVDGVSVRYNQNLVVDRVSFTVARGTVYALLGRNGAGKSSIMRCLLGLQKATSGQVFAFGEDVWKHRARLLGRTAYVPETSDAPGQLRVLDVAAFHESMYPAWEGRAVRDRLARIGVSLSATVGALSKGQRALFTLALALGSKPELLVLDDPTLGLDVVARNDFFSDFIGELAERGTTVILTTHDLAGVEGIADRVGILQGARLAIDEEVEQLKSERGQSLEQIFTDITRVSGRLS